MLEQRDGRFVDTSGNNSTSFVPKTGEDEFMRLQEQIHSKSVKAIREVKIENRDHSSVTMAISRRSIPSAKKLIRSFSFQLCEFLESSAGSNPDHVYSFCASLFPLTKEKWQ